MQPFYVWVLPSPTLSHIFNETIKVAVIYWPFAIKSLFIEAETRNDAH